MKMELHSRLPHWITQCDNFSSVSMERAKWTRHQSRCEGEIILPFRLSRNNLFMKN